VSQKTLVLCSINGTTSKIFRGQAENHGCTGIPGGTSKGGYSFVEEQTAVSVIITQIHLILDEPWFQLRDNISPRVDTVVEIKGQTKKTFDFTSEEA
jgi:hypothetical protein